MVSVNYIVAIYGGVRRSHPEGTHILKFIKAHLEYLKDPSQYITHATFVFNKSNTSEEKIVIKYLRSLKSILPIPIKIIVRDNKGGSYGAWNEGVSKTYKKYSHSFLIEDDYIPFRKDFINYFLEKDNEDISFVASLYREEHAAISNGLLKNNHIPQILEKYNAVFNIIDLPNLPYSQLCQNQRTFLHYFPEKLIDITDIAHTIFFSYPAGNIIYKDSTLPLLIHPII
jgi:hypothetical protein